MEEYPRMSSSGVTPRKQKAIFDQLVVRLRELRDDGNVEERAAAVMELWDTCDDTVGPPDDPKLAELYWQTKPRGGQAAEAPDMAAKFYEFIADADDDGISTATIMELAKSMDPRREFLEFEIADGFLKIAFSDDSELYIEEALDVDENDRAIPRPPGEERWRRVLVGDPREVYIVAPN